MKSRTLQSLLAERRATVFEKMREVDPVARAILDFHVGWIDQEILARHNHPSYPSTLAVDADS